ncbi:MAG: hypothetical protein Q4G28_11010 [Neisseria sp.]|nr:hypothetical protein [Neisseria sp.]
MEAIKHIIIVAIMTIYQIIFVIIVGFFIYPILVIAGNLVDGIKIEFSQILFDTIDGIYSKIYSATFLKMIIAAIFIRLIAGYWLSRNKTVNEDKNKPRSC